MIKPMTNASSACHRPRPVAVSRVAAAVKLALAASAIVAVSGLSVRAAIILDSVTVRLYDSVGVAQADRSAALATAASILARADLDVAWIICTPTRAGRVPSRCDTPPAPYELVVRLTNSVPTAEDGNRRAFGYSLIDAATGNGTLSTVFVDRVDWL